MGTDAMNLSVSSLALAANEAAQHHEEMKA
jgi:hypothetical protein